MDKLKLIFKSSENTKIIVPFKYSHIIWISACSVFSYTTFYKLRQCEEEKQIIYKKNKEYIVEAKKKKTNIKEDTLYDISDKNMVIFSEYFSEKELPFHQRSILELYKREEEKSRREFKKFMPLLLLNGPFFPIPTSILCGSIFLNQDLYTTSGIMLLSFLSLYKLIKLRN